MLALVQIVQVIGEIASQTTLEFKKNVLALSQNSSPSNSNTNPAPNPERDSFFPPSAY